MFQFIGNSSVAQAVLSSQSHGQFFTINIAYGLAVTLAVLVAGGVSGTNIVKSMTIFPLLKQHFTGAHLNPAVTLSLALVGKFPFRKVPHYMIAQYLGAFVSAACTLLVYQGTLIRLFTWSSHDERFYYRCNVQL